MSPVANWAPEFHPTAPGASDQPDITFQKGAGSYLVVWSDRTLGWREIYARRLIAAGSFLCEGVSSAPPVRIGEVSGVRVEKQGTTVRILWNPIFGAVGYRVYRGDLVPLYAFDDYNHRVIITPISPVGSVGSCFEAAPVFVPLVLSPDGASFYWLVSAFDAAGVEGPIAGADLDGNGTDESPRPAGPADCT